MSSRLIPLFGMPGQTASLMPALEKKWLINDITVETVVLLSRV